MRLLTQQNAYVEGSHKNCIHYIFNLLMEVEIDHYVKI